MRIQLSSVIAAVVIVGTATVCAADTRIQAKDLPLPVQKAVQEATRGATIKGYAREVEGGKTMFEVETILNGHSRDLLFDARGALVEIKEAIRLDDVPAAVRTALEGRGRVLTIEQVTRGSSITYEATVQRNGKKAEVAVNANGTPVKR